MRSTVDSLCGFPTSRLGDSARSASRCICANHGDKAPTSDHRLPFELHMPPRTNPEALRRPSSPPRTTGHLWTVWVAQVHEPPNAGRFKARTVQVPKGVP
jgi:hypothetical protein